MMEGVFSRGLFRGEINVYTCKSGVEKTLGFTIRRKAEAGHHDRSCCCRCYGHQRTFAPSCTVVGSSGFRTWLDMMRWRYF